MPGPNLNFFILNFVHLNLDVVSGFLDLRALAPPPTDSTHLTHPSPPPCLVFRPCGFVPWSTTSIIKLSSSHVEVNYPTSIPQDSAHPFANSRFLWHRLLVLTILFSPDLNKYWLFSFLLVSHTLCSSHLPFFSNCFLDNGLPTTYKQHGLHRSF